MDFLGWSSKSRTALLKAIAQVSASLGLPDGPANLGGPLLIPPGGWR